MTKIIIIILLLTGVGFTFFQLTKNKSIPTPLLSPSPEAAEIQNTEFKASFAVFTNGTFRIFTDSRYHNLSENVYIGSKNPNIVIIKNENTTWKDFFATLPMKIDSNCITTGTGQVFCSGEKGRLKFFINGRADPEALNKKINNGDKLLVSFGAENQSQIETQLAQIPDIL